MKGRSSLPDLALEKLITRLEALRARIEPELHVFYRSIHQIVGHRIDLVDHRTARGQTYCRAEHEVGERWVVMAIRYDDRHQKVNGEWLFECRRERHWYANDVTERPQEAAFNGWTGTAPPPDLPHVDGTWSSFWSGHDTDRLTQQP